MVKLDRQVIARLGMDPASDATVAAATTFVLGTGGWVIAEGIEDPRMLGALLDNAEGRSQERPLLAGPGYLLGRPAPRPQPIDTHLDLLSDDGAPATTPAGLYVTGTEGYHHPSG